MQIWKINTVLEKKESKVIKKLIKKKYSKSFTTPRSLFTFKQLCDIEHFNSFVQKVSYSLRLIHSIDVCVQMTLQKDLLYHGFGWF